LRGVPAAHDAGIGALSGPACRFSGEDLPARLIQALRFIAALSTVGEGR